MTTLAKTIDSALSLGANLLELGWLYLQLWVLRLDIYSIRAWSWITANPDEAIGSATALLGAYLLARNGKWASMGWLAFLASNFAIINLAMRLDRPGILVMQLGFTCTSMLGLWTWVVKPRWTAYLIACCAGADQRLNMARKDAQ